MESVGCSETSVRNYHYSLSNNPEERSFQLLRGTMTSVGTRTEIRCPPIDIGP